MANGEIKPGVLSGTVGQYPNEPCLTEPASSSGKVAWVIFDGPKPKGLEGGFPKPPKPSVPVLWLGVPNTFAVLAAELGPCNGSGPYLLFIR